MYPCCHPSHLRRLGDRLFNYNSKHPHSDWGVGGGVTEHDSDTLFCHVHTEQDSNTLLCLMRYYLCLYIRQNECCNLIFNLLATIQTDIHVFTSAKYDSLHFSRKLIVIHRNWQDWNLYDPLLTSVILLLLFFRLFKS